MQTRKLGAVADYIRGVTFTPDQQVDPGALHGIVCLRTKNVQSTLDQSDLLWVAASVVKRDELYLKPDDILISSANSANLVGKCCIVPELGFAATAGGFIAIIRAKAGVEPEYLFRWLSSPRTQALVRGCARQTTNIANISVPQLLDLELPFLEMPVQKQVALRFELASRLQCRRKASVDAANALPSAIFLEMFGDPVENPRGWPSKTLGDLALELRYGTSLPCVTERTATAWPVLRIPNVVGGEIEWGDLKFTELPRDAQEALKMLKGDVLFVRSNGNPEHIGRAAATREDAEAAFASYLIRARLRPEAGMLPDLLVAMMSTPSFRSLLTAQARTTAGNYNISAEALRRLPLIVPPMPLQERFVEALDEVRRLKETLKQSLAETEALYASLSDRYFGAP